MLLLDEPSSGIAQRETEALGPLLLRIRDELGRALLVIEHDMPLMTSVADRLIAMDQGRVIAEGDPSDVLHDPGSSRRTSAPTNGWWPAPGHCRPREKPMRPSVDRPTRESYAPAPALGADRRDRRGGGGRGGCARASAARDKKKTDVGTKVTGKLPTGAISFSEAKAKNLNVTFPKTCDPKTGRVAMPFYFVPECFANVKNNQGATAPGVTADTIKVVVYSAPENDPIINYITAAIKNDDTRASESRLPDLHRHVQPLLPDLRTKVQIEFLNGSGNANDEVAARADAARRPA